MTIKKPVAGAERKPAEGYEDAPKPSATERYVEELSRMAGGYAKPAAEARRIIDRDSASLTDALYKMRRTDGRVK